MERHRKKQIFALLELLDRPGRDAEVDPTMLFGVNFDVDSKNREKLDDMPDPAKIYKAVDSGKIRFTY